MLRFCANLSMMYTEFPFLERFGAAAKDGFKGVEYLFPYEFPAETLAAELKKHGLEQVIFNAPPGDFAAGDRGMASIPGREEEFRDGFHAALRYAPVLGCSKMHVMAGLAPQDANLDERHSVYVENLKWAVQLAEEHNLTLMIEPINHRDMPGYFLATQEQAHTIVKEIGSGALRVQFDLYHCQIAEGDVAMRIRKYLTPGHENRVGHMQVAGVPERHEPSLGELHYPYLFRVLEEVKYDGWIGCEYRPQHGTSDGLGWLREYWAGK